MRPASYFGFERIPDRCGGNSLGLVGRVLAAATAQDVPTLDLAVAMGPGDLSELVIDRSSEVHGDLEARLEGWGRDPVVAAQLRALPPGSLNLGVERDPRRPVDTIHPNFLGHYLAARATADWLAEDP